MILQVEIAKDLLTATDLTIAGILLAFIAILLIDNNRKEKKIEKRDDYIREQDKETLKILSELTNMLKVIQDSDKEIKNFFPTVNDKVTDNNSMLRSIYNAIQQKLLNMDNK
tara:strand:- start:29 stop:364 length:336 start_codon:yes stop_codon:yes gene_type:complete